MSKGKMSTMWEKSSTWKGETASTHVNQIWYSENALDEISINEMISKILNDEYTTRISINIHVEYEYNCSYAETWSGHEIWHVDDENNLWVE